MCILDEADGHFKPRAAPAKRVLSLTDPTQKMSKSAPNPNSRILITDPPETIIKKIRGAVTDSDRTLSWDPEARRGVSNLLSILDACRSGLPGISENENANESLSQDEKMGNLASRLREEGIASHAQLKSIVSESVIEKLRGIRESYLEIREDRGYLSSVAKEGKERAGEVARRTMAEVRKKVGLSSI